MAKPIITIGCKTSHGGTVVSGSMVSDVHGKSIARIGDKVPCPQCKGTHIIVSGDLTLIVDGAAVARDGDKTSCGAVLIADQMTSLVDQGFASFLSSSDTNTSIEKSNSAASKQMQQTSATVAEHEHAYDLQFQLNGKDGGQPMANVPYKITLENGEEITGITDVNGLTQLVSNNSAIMAKLEAPYYGNSRKQINTGIGQDTCHC
jgi:uncharacterized Zn-binding protein involved in type VI secretion